jgi:hypothetical protein
MYSLETIANFLGWCSLINIGILLFTTLMIKAFMGPVAKLHSNIFGVPESELPMTYYWYLALYKIAILVFNLVPYLALRIIL